MKRICMVIALLALTTGTGNAFLWGPPVKITGLFVYAQDNTAFIKTDNNQNPDNCSNGTNYLALDMSAPHFRELYAIALTAYTTGATVSLNYNGCADVHPLIKGIALPQIW